MPRLPTEPHDDQEYIPSHASERWTMGCLAILFGLLAFWIGWIVANFLDGRGWFDLIVSLVLDEVILAVGLLSITLLIWALFAPPKITRIFESVSANAVKSAVLFFAILIVPWLLFVVVWSALSAIGVVR